MGDRSKKIKMNLSKAMDKNKPALVFLPEAYRKKQADYLVIKFGSDLANLNEKINVF